MTYSLTQARKVSVFIDEESDALWNLNAKEEEDLYLVLDLIARQSAGKRFVKVQSIPANNVFRIRLKTKSARGKPQRIICKCEGIGKDLVIVMVSLYDKNNKGSNDMDKRLLDRCKQISKIKYRYEQGTNS